MANEITYHCIYRISLLGELLLGASDFILSARPF